MLFRSSVVEPWLACAAVLLLLPFAAHARAASPSSDGAPLQSSVRNEKGDIYSFIVHSKIKYRYAQTVVSSRVVNKDIGSREVQFELTIPDSAFVSKFLMEINDKVYEAYVKDKDQAKDEYVAARRSGQTAAHVEQNVRDSNAFMVSVNVEAEGKVTFNLTYDQLLPRKFGVYENVINVKPGQVVKNLQVIVDIEESSGITNLEVPAIKFANEIETIKKQNKQATISRESTNKATVSWLPTVKQQRSFGEQGVLGQFIVQYDVDHKSTPNQILIDDGYFVHFFAPDDLRPLSTHVVFALDVSGSMGGQKLSQLKQAMVQILTEMSPNDFFTLIPFSEIAQLWTIDAVQHTSSYFKCLEPIVDHTFVYPATTTNIQYAKQFIENLRSDSSTNIEEALTKAHTAASALREERFERFVNGTKPMIVFLTDGEPVEGITDHEELITYLTNLYEEKYPIFSLGFGNEAKMDFLKKLSLNNHGFARKIYEASDVVLQLRNFYKEISAPILSNVTFNYIDTQIDSTAVTKQSFDLLFNGTELVVAGKLKNPNITLIDTSNVVRTNEDFERLITVTCYDEPFNPQVTELQHRKIGHFEKLWAYLTVKQLIDEFNKNGNSMAKARALELALKYSFVTPITSLVVVRPDGDKTSLTHESQEKIQPIAMDRSSSSSNNWRFHGMPRTRIDTSFGSGLENYNLLPPIDPLALNLDYSRRVMKFKNRPHITSQTTTPPTALIVNTTPQQADTSSFKPSSYDIGDLRKLPWLNVSESAEPSIALNQTNNATNNYRVLLKTSDQVYQNCTTPENLQGRCKHLKDCVSDTIYDSLNQYIPLFCPIENVYAGICCLNQVY